MGLDKPVYLQYWTWLTAVVTGEWGRSLVMKQPITTLIALRLKNSAFLAVTALLSVVVLGIPLGVWAAIKRGTRLDLFLTAGSYLGISLPEFVTGTLLILLLAGPPLRLLPSGGYHAFTDNWMLWLKHLVLPTTTLTILLLAHVVRQTRSGMIDVLQSAYIRTAYLKGLPQRTVIVKHALKNGLLPTITVLAMDLGYLMGSIVIVEEVFAYPGMGRLIVLAIQNRDIPLVQMAVLLIAVIYAGANFVADLLYTYLDPRIRYD
ncbi:MAG: ABC transporter permease [Nitrospinota bacterium]|nr:MAG: ABC transporter permease [Nitrospinota bacterium]